MQAAIEIEDLTKIYSTGDGEVKAVDSLQVSVPQGEVFGFLGPNGAGKTTTVQMLMRIIYPTGGSARLLGKPLDDLDARAKIGYLPEMFQFHAFLRADEFLDFHGRLYGMSGIDRKSRTDEVLSLVGLEDKKKSRIRTFSQGMLQRIGIAQAIMNRPQLLFMDEPTSALDPMGRRDMRELIISLKEEGTTIFLNSHLLSEVEMTCDRVGIINHGQLIRVSDLESMMRSGHSVEIRAIGIDAETMQRIRQMATHVEEGKGSLVVTVEHEEELSALARMIIDSGASLTEFNPRRIPLEESFLQIIDESNPGEPPEESGA